MAGLMPQRGPYEDYEVSVIVLTRMPFLLKGKYQTSSTTKRIGDESYKTANNPKGIPMSLKLNIPDISKDYKGALADYLLDFPKDQRDDFYKYFNLVSGYCLNAEICMSMSGLGGAITIEELLNKSSGFELATLKEFIRFHKEGYSGGDFQHIFLNAFLSIRADMLMLGLKEDSDDSR